MKGGRQRLRRFLGVVAVLLLAYTLIGWLLGERLSRGHRVVDGLGPVEPGVWDGAMRFAWVEIGPLPAPFGAHAESAPAFAPGSGDLYFSRRHPEAGWELYRARRTPGGYAAPEPMFEVNSLADDTDPCLIDGGRVLVFASNRDGGRGGFDLYGATVGRDGIGDVRILAELSSPADERQPTADASGRLLVFASNRLSEDGVRLELFESERAAGSFLPARRLEELEVPAPSEARCPELSADGRFLYYAADLPAGAGGYDLYRAVRHQARWVQPEILSAFATPEDELDPALSPGGERLAFARSTPESVGLTTQLCLAERQEVVSIVVPGRTISGQSLLLLVAVLAAVCLTYLTLRWRDLHPFTKFLLLSLLVHLLCLLLVDPDSGGARGDSPPREFAVQFLGAEEAPTPDQPTAATGEKVEVDRAVSEAPAAVAQMSEPETPELDRVQTTHEAIAPREIAVERPAAAAVPRRQQTGTARTALRSPARSNGDPRKAAEASPYEAMTEATRTGEEARQQAAVQASGPRSAAPSALPTTALPGFVAPRGGAVARLTESPADLERPATGRRTRAPAPGAGLALGSASRGAAQKDSPAVEALRVVTRPASAAGASGPAAPVVDAGGGVGVAASAPVADLPAPPFAGARSPPGELDTAADAVGHEMPGEQVAVRRHRAPSLARTTARDPGAPAPRGDVVVADGAARTRATANERASAVARAPAPVVAPLRSERRGEPATPAPGADAGRPGSALARREVALGDMPSAGAPTPRRRARPGRARPVEFAGGRARPATPSGSGATGHPTVVQARGLTAAPLEPQLSHRPPASSAGADRGHVETVLRPVTPRDLLRRRAVELEPEAAAAVLTGRRGQAKIEALERGGGTAQTEEAVLAGLRYLQACQREGGAWGDDGEHRKYGEVRIGKSGLALLAFLGSGYTHDRPNEFRRTVTRVLAFLLRRQDDRTGHIGDGSSYSHGIATYAIAEAYAMTRDPALRRPLELAVERIVRAQMRGRGPKTGGWGYYYAGRPRHDDGWPRMSASIWQVMALESASLAGVSVPSESLDAARGFVLASWDQELGAVRYNHDAQWRRAGYETLPGSTSGGLFAMQLLGVPREDHRYRGALAFVLARPPAFPWRRHSNDDMVLRVQGNLYFHYHATLALYRHGGKEWQRWNAILKPQLVDNQERDGSWRPISAYADYAGDTRTDRSYTTAMCVLMLEVYYRYLTPLLEGGAASQTAAGSKATPGPADVWIEVLEVRPDSAADRLGMKAGDRILRLAGRTPATLADLDKALGEITVDRPAVLTLDRAGRTVQIVLRRRLTGVRVQVRRGR